MDNTSSHGAATDNVAADTSEADQSKRGRSKISFVYNDLESAVDLARVLQSRAGTTCETSQLASWMNQSAEGGTFRSILGAARSFGLVETQQGSVSLTTLGRDALDDSRRPNALAEAFLRVPLHHAMYEAYKGYALPPPAAIERQMENLGVPPKQKERARQTFTKSAHHAGYIDPPTGRFIKPAAAAPAPSDPIPPKKNGDDDNGGGDGGDPPRHPFIEGLITTLPKPDSSWPLAAQAKWLQTAASIFGLIYKSDDVGIIEVKACPL